MSDSCDLMDCSPSGSSVREILQARILEWVAISFSSGSFPFRNWTRVSCIVGRFFTDWAMREFNKENWAPKNWCFWTVVLKKTLESALESKKIKPVHPKGNQSWIFIGRIDAEAEAAKLWSPDVKNWLIRKDPDAGKDWKQEEKGTTGWDGGMASPTWWIWVWASPECWWWTGKPGVLLSIESQESDMIEWLNWIKKEAMKKPLEARLKEPEKLIKIRRSDYLRLCTHPNLISNPTLEVFS